MSAIVWWEIETAEPGRLEFYAALSGWVFVPAFEGTELGADYWIIRQEGESIGGLQPPALYLLGTYYGCRTYGALITKCAGPLSSHRVHGPSVINWEQGGQAMASLCSSGL